MGIHNLLKYIKSYTDDNKLTQICRGNSIYVSSIVYFDFTSKLIELYNKFIRFIPEGNISILIDKISDEIMKMFNKILNFNKSIYVFIDYRKMTDIDERLILFRDFVITMNEVNEHEYINATPVIKKKYISNNSDVYKMMSKVRCLFEIKSFSNIGKVDKNDYVNLFEFMEEICKHGSNGNSNGSNSNGSNDNSNSNGNDNSNSNGSNDELLFEKIERVINHGWYRYLILRGAKRNTIDERNKKLFHKNRKNVNNIPFTAVMYAIPLIINKIYKNKIFTETVSFFGCNVESDFALSRHVHIYHKFSYPTIYSNDTDMVALLCDVDCSVKFMIKDISGEETLSLFVNPKMFWKRVFGCNLKPSIIKIICVLLGTDYNPYHPKSPIHLKKIDDILHMLNINKFKEIDEDELLLKIYTIMNANENSIYVKQTATALNVYLNDVENSLYILTGNENINMNDFLDRFHSYDNGI